jgi:hypothetical protein
VPDPHGSFVERLSKCQFWFGFEQEQIVDSQTKVPIEAGLMSSVEAAAMCDLEVCDLEVCDLEVGVGTNIRLDVCPYLLNMVKRHSEGPRTIGR